MTGNALAWTPAFAGVTESNEGGDETERRSLRDLSVEPGLNQSTHLAHIRFTRKLGL